LNNSGVILVLAYPETIVMVADEWYSKFLRFIGIGKKNYVRAGHAALVLINKETGVLEYHDFGRYITPEPYGRVRGRDTDNELHFPIKAQFESGKIQNLEAVLQFLATHPKLTHGDGKLIASVCDEIDYALARKHITQMQRRDFIRYAAFKKEACNCARFVTDALIAGLTNEVVKRKLQKSKRFTPSTTGNVVIAATDKKVYEVSEEGKISDFTQSIWQDNKEQFLDRLEDYEPSFVGTLQPKENNVKSPHAQWLSGIAAGAWFELYETANYNEYRMRRVSPYGHIDCDAFFKTDAFFDINEAYEFVHYSNCLFFNVRQGQAIIRFDRI
jgi:hypothetical protein